MRVLIAIPHYYSPNPKTGTHGSQVVDPTMRAKVVLACLTRLNTHFARPQVLIDIERRTTLPANQPIQLQIVICTTQGKHLMDVLPKKLPNVTHLQTQAEPLFLGYECHRVLRDGLQSGYDFYCYLEDDLLIHDPLFFDKLRWFQNGFNSQALLMPNRYEVGDVSRSIRKAYIDGVMRRGVTDPFQNMQSSPDLNGEVFGNVVLFHRVSNPHSGSFFLTAEQLRTWSEKPYFLDKSTAFIGPLESAATLGVLRTFNIYKPAINNAAFLELEHAGQAYLSLIRSSQNS